MSGSRRWVVDSIEEGIAAVHDGAGIVRVPAWMLPPGAREGDVLAVEQSVGADGASSLRIAVDSAATEDALRRSREQVSRAARRDPGGDIVL
jgi:DNA-binding transcriptional LysR family regulator